MPTDGRAHGYAEGHVCDKTMLPKSWHISYGILVMAYYAEGHVCDKTMLPKPEIASSV